MCLAAIKRYWIIINTRPQLLTHKRVFTCFGIAAEVYQRAAYARSYEWSMKLFQSAIVQLVWNINKLIYVLVYANNNYKRRALEAAATNHNKRA